MHKTIISMLLYIVRKRRGGGACLRIGNGRDTYVRRQAPPTAAARERREEQRGSQDLGVTGRGRVVKIIELFGIDLNIESSK